jgi:hypothetical protein
MRQSPLHALLLLLRMMPMPVLLPPRWPRWRLRPLLRRRWAPGCDNVWHHHHHHHRQHQQVWRQQQRRRQIVS